jgi:hypothetical protein
MLYETRPVRQLGHIDAQSMMACGCGGDIILNYGQCQPCVMITQQGVKA